VINSFEETVFTSVLLSFLHPIFKPLSHFTAELHPYAPANNCANFRILWRTKLIQNIFYEILVENAKEREQLARENNIKLDLNV
jgi:hypothetical protein